MQIAHLSQAWMETLGSTLLHFLWQGALIAALYAAVRRFLDSPPARYLLGCTALSLMLAAPLATFAWLNNPLPAPPMAPLSLPHGVTPAPVQNLPFASLSWNSVAASRPGILSIVVMLWLTGAVGFCARLLGGWILAARLRSTLVRPAPRDWQQTLSRLGARLGMSRSVRLLVSARVQVPTVIGCLRPLVLVPVGVLVGLPAGQVEALLLHELAHIRRHDYLVNMLQSVAEALLFYHPAVWWVSRNVRHERETCCDRVAAEAVGDVLAYASALAELESCRPPRLAAVAANGGSLSDRIARLLGVAPQPSAANSGLSAMFTAILLTAAACGVFAQSAPTMRFEVASIKLNTDTGRRIIRVSPRPGGVLVTENATVRLLIQNAYTLQPFQITGGPGWLQSDGYNIDAKGSPTATRAQVFLMLQALLEDRFQLKYHHETKDLPVYALTMPRNGSKLAKSKDDCIPKDPNGPPAPAPPPGPSSARPCGAAMIMLESSKARIQGVKLPMAEFTRVLAIALGRPVIDKTGFTDPFDLVLDFTPDESVAGLPRAMGAADPGSPVTAADPTAPPPILVAVQEQLGLKLESARGPVSIMVIDHVERPSAN